jgi:RHS repeat-associated protein
VRGPWSSGIGALASRGWRSSPLSLNTWRVYDPRVGQYLTPEPMATEGATRWSAFGYALEAPYDLWDPDGRFISSCTATPSAAAACGAGIGGGGFLGTSALGGGAAAGGAAGATGGAVAGGIAAPTAGQAIAGAICVAAAATTTHVLPDATTGVPDFRDGNAAGCYLLDRDGSGNLTNEGGGYRGGPTVVLCRYICRGFGSGGASIERYNCHEPREVCSVEFAPSKSELRAELTARGCYPIPWRPPFWPGR